MSLEEALALFENSENIDTTSVNEFDLGCEVLPPKWVVSENGLLQVFCSGRVIAQFRPTRDNTSLRYYLVVDDNHLKVVASI